MAEQIRGKRISEAAEQVQPHSDPVVDVVRQVVDDDFLFGGNQGGNFTLQVVSKKIATPFAPTITRHTPIATSRTARLFVKRRSLMVMAKTVQAVG